MSDTCSPTDSFPIRSSLEVELVEDGIDGRDEVGHLFSSVTGSRGDSESFFTDGDGGVIDGLYAVRTKT